MATTNRNDDAETAMLQTALAEARARHRRLTDELDQAENGIRLLLRALSRTERVSP